MGERPVQTCTGEYPTGRMYISCRGERRGGWWAGGPAGKSCPGLEIGPVGRRVKEGDRGRRSISSFQGCETSAPRTHMQEDPYREEDGGVVRWLSHGTRRPSWLRTFPARPSDDCWKLAGGAVLPAALFSLEFHPFQPSSCASWRPESKPLHWAAEPAIWVPRICWRRLASFISAT